MRDLLFSIFNIFRFCGRFITVFRNLVFNLIFLAILVIIALSFIPDEVTTIPKNSILRLSIEGNIVEEKQDSSPFSKLLEDELYSDSPAKETALQDILDAIKNASNDENISVLLLDLKYMSGGGLNQLKSIGDALLEFKTSGKPVVASQDFYTQSQYYLASYANTVILNPLGGVDLHGFGVYRLYFREAMDKLGVQYNVFKVGDYKSALEPFLRNDMSEADRQQNREWLESLWSLYTSDVARQRKIPLQNLKNYTFNASIELRRVAGDTAQLALESGLIDQVWTKEKIYQHLKEISGTVGLEPKFISMTNYLASTSVSYQPAPDKTSAIALIIAEGNILPGKQPPGQIGGETLSELIREARKDNRMKALVLRINSGGGSAFASEVIRQELIEFQNTGRPVVISMGTVAASGGYWLAANADEIWASEATITGSIGIFGALPTFEKTLEKIGVYSDGLGTTPLASGLDLSQPLADELKDVLQQSVNNNYERFLDIVATGRKLSKDEVRALAGGRVYDGISAQKLGLVDNLGSLGEAIEAAASLAQVTDYSTEYIAPPVSVREQVMRIFSSENLSIGKSNLNNSWYKAFEQNILNKLKNLSSLNDPQGIYAHWMTEISM